MKSLNFLKNTIVYNSFINSYQKLERDEMSINMRMNKRIVELSHNCIVLNTVKKSPIGTLWINLKEILSGKKKPWTKDILTLLFHLCEILEWVKLVIWVIVSGNGWRQTVTMTRAWGKFLGLFVFYNVKGAWVAQVYA